MCTCYTTLVDMHPKKEDMNNQTGKQFLFYPIIIKVFLAIFSLVMLFSSFFLENEAYPLNSLAVFCHSKQHLFFIFFSSNLIFLFCFFPPVVSHMDAFCLWLQFYPTSMRAMGLGACSGMARIGAIITPFVAQVGLGTCTPPLWRKQAWVHLTDRGHYHAICGSCRPGYGHTNTDHFQVCLGTCVSSMP